MTVSEKLQTMLVERGMFESQAKEVMELAIPKLKDLVEDYSINFNSDQGSYPDVIYSTLFLYVKPIALEWINENKPLAWFKPLFI